MTSCLHCGHEDPGGFAFCPRCGTKAVEPVGTRDPLLGRILNGKYRIESEIGSGAMGTVYVGEHIGLKKRVALKVLRPDLQVTDESLQRFQREGIAAGKFDHPHAIQIFDFDRGEGRIFYLAMEYVDGVNLGHYLRQRGRLPCGVALELLRQVLSCLGEAHRHGIVHRDLKPDNIMVIEDVRGGLRVKLLDFGLSKLVDRRLASSLATQAGRLLGTPLYMAPEQVAGEEADERSDLYAAGLILYEMLAGERPFGEQDTAQFFLTRPAAEAPSLAADHPELEIPAELDAVIARALERERGQRFQTAEEMLLALDEVRPDGVSHARPERAHAPRAARSAPVGAPAAARPRSPVPPGPPVPQPARAWRLLVALGVLALASVALAALWFGRERTLARPALVRSIPESERSATEQRYVGLLDEARLALLAGDTARAVTAVEQASLLDCRDAEVVLARADVYRSRGDLDSALATYRAAAASDAGFVEPLLGMGWIQLERGDLTGAEESFGRAHELAPDSAAVLAARGALAWSRDDRAAADELLQRALERDSSCASARLYLGRLRLDQGDAEAAIAALVEAKRLDTRSVQTLRWLGEAYLARERFDEADAQLEEAARLAPEAVELSQLRASLLIDRRQPEKALELLESALARRSDPKLWILRGVALNDAGRPDEALAALRRGFDQGARDGHARCLYGALLHARGQLSEARAQYEAALEELGDYPLANLDLGLVLFAEKEYERAAERLERVLAFDEENAAAHFHLGLLQMDYLPDPAQAAAHFRRYQALGGTDPRVEGWLDELE